MSVRRYIFFSLSCLLPAQTAFEPVIFFLAPLLYGLFLFNRLAHVPPLHGLTPPPPTFNTIPTVKAEYGRLLVAGYDSKSVPPGSGTPNLSPQPFEENYN